MAHRRRTLTGKLRRRGVAMSVGLLMAGGPTAAQTLDTPVIGHRVPMIRVGKDEYSGVEFDIVGFKDGWFLIGNGSDDD